ncbi:Bet v I domain-containing protein [Artemisia annua]|uniref:Bet v I domain-containing protein n=1 Tax=Artemisia annua TaxID=35608 RepID=A0A2U1KNK0_ARTAN|nr:Bet v I domain-containing protein [Artemisia annua]
MYKYRSGFTSYIEKFTKIDHENKVKEVEIVEGGFLDIGFNFYRMKTEIIEDPKDDTSSSCIVKSTLEYDVKEEFAANASFATSEPLVAIMSAANEHLLKSN